MFRFLLAFTVFSAATALPAQRSHVTSACPPGIHSISSCPADGCGSSTSDTLLNEAKNRMDSPTGEFEVFQVRDIAALDQPSDWLTGQERDSISTLEGKPVRLMGYLKQVKAEGGETCNCELQSAASTDLHLVIVGTRNGAEAASATAEITPRVRLASHPTWTFAKISTLKGKYVRVSGWLMLDTAHVPHSTKIDENDHAGNVLNRATNWEVHPVTRLQVCASTISKCKNGTGWRTVN